MGAPADIPAPIRDQLRDASAEQRLAAIERLAQLPKELPTPPYDAILERLRECATSDDDRNVRNAAHAAKRPVAIARGLRMGLRSTLSKDELAQLDDRALVWGSIELVWDAVSIYDGPKVLAAGLDLATRGQEGVYAVWWTQSEVRNGGFRQYFGNATGVVAPYAVSGFERIGANALASVVDRAMKKFAGGRPPGEHEKRRSAVREFDAKTFDALDTEFYGHVNSLFALAAKYVRDHVAEFFDIA